MVGLKANLDNINKAVAGYLGISVEKLSSDEFLKTIKDVQQLPRDQAIANKLGIKSDVQPRSADSQEAKELDRILSKGVLDWKKQYSDEQKQIIREAFCKIPPVAREALVLEGDLGHFFREVLNSNSVDNKKTLFSCYSKFIKKRRSGEELVNEYQPKKQKRDVPLSKIDVPPSEISVYGTEKASPVQNILTNKSSDKETVLRDLGENALFKGYTSFVGNAIESGFRMLSTGRKLWAPDGTLRRDESIRVEITRLDNDKVKAGTLPAEPKQTEPTPHQDNNGINKSSSFNISPNIDAENVDPRPEINNKETNNVTINNIEKNTTTTNNEEINISNNHNESVTLNDAGTNTDTEIQNNNEGDDETDSITVNNSQNTNTVNNDEINISNNHNESVTLKDTETNTDTEIQNNNEENKGKKEVIEDRKVDDTLTPPPGTTNSSSTTEKRTTNTLPNGTTTIIKEKETIIEKSDTSKLKEEISNLKQKMSELEARPEGSQAAPTIINKNRFYFGNSKEVSISKNGKIKVSGKPGRTGKTKKKPKTDTENTTNSISQTETPPDTGKTKKVPNFDGAEITIKQVKAQEISNANQFLKKSALKGTKQEDITVESLQKKYCPTNDKSEKERETAKRVQKFIAAAVLSMGKNISEMNADQLETTLQFFALIGADPASEKKAEIIQVNSHPNETSSFDSGKLYTELFSPLQQSGLLGNDQNGEIQNKLKHFSALLNLALPSTDDAQHAQLAARNAFIENVQKELNTLQKFGNGKLDGELLDEILRDALRNALIQSKIQISEQMQATINAIVGSCGFNPAQEEAIHSTSPEESPQKHVSDAASSLKSLTDPELLKSKNNGQQLEAMARASGRDISEFFSPEDQKAGPEHAIAKFVQRTSPEQFRQERIQEQITTIIQDYQNLTPGQRITAQGFLKTLANSNSIDSNNRDTIKKFLKKPLMNSIESTSGNGNQPIPQPITNQNGSQPSPANGKVTFNAANFSATRKQPLSAPEQEVTRVEGGSEVAINPNK